MSALLLLFLAAGIPVHVSPAAATVGDPIRVVFAGDAAGTVTLDPSEEYEVVDHLPDGVVIRSFKPGPITLSGTVARAGGGYRFGPLELEIHSILGENDSLEPAPLRPPKSLPPNRVAWGAIGIAGLVAALLWYAVARASAATAAPVMRKTAARPPSVELLGALDAAQSMDRAAALIAVGAATRRFLARVEPSWSLDRTSKELKVELSNHGLDGETLTTVDLALMEADLEKFSPWGAPEIDRDELIARVRKLVSLDRGAGA
ncbi:MAG TPA: hypothetical protein VM557_07140 [Thermoanaerobaculia bacterium]|nr:hypothetical protein [Thermoanaerobaculia bacterium]